MGETVFRHIAHVCHICKSSDAEAYYGHLTMHYPNGQNAYASDIYTLARHNFVQFQFRRPGIEVFSEAIWHTFFQVLYTKRFCIYRYRPEDTEGAQIVHPADVVVMFMGQQDGIQFSERQP